MNKREFLKSFALLSASVLVKPSLANSFSSYKKRPSLDNGIGGFKLPNLVFSFNALEPHIDALTMEIHHDKHHAGYVANLNKALESSRFTKNAIEDILHQVNPEEAAIRNNAGGHYNHSLFWKLLTPNSTKKPNGKLAEAIDKKFGSFEKFQAEFETAAKNRFGSGWAWLSVNDKKELFISSTPNQDSPLMSNIIKKEEQGFPVLGLDIWEHAYYLHYQNRRPDYVSAFWNVVNWKYAEERYQLAVGK